MRIISFLELLFEVEKDDRSLKFDRIAAHCKVDKNDVELLLMKAMSLQLIKGNIDEVEEVIHVNWMLPRYLSRGHIEIMARKLQDWENKMDHVIRLVEGQSEELLLNLWDYYCLKEFIYNMLIIHTYVKVLLATSTQMKVSQISS